MNAAHKAVRAILALFDMSAFTVTVTDQPYDAALMEIRDPQNDGLLITRGFTFETGFMDSLEFELSKSFTYVAPPTVEKVFLSCHEAGQFPVQLIEKRANGGTKLLFCAATVDELSALIDLAVNVEFSISMADATRYREAIDLRAAPAAQPSMITLNGTPRPRPTMDQVLAELDEFDAAPAALFDVAALPVATLETLKANSPFSEAAIMQTLKEVSALEGLDDHEVPVAVFATGDGEIWAFNEHSLLSSFPDDDDHIWEFDRFLGDDGLTVEAVAATLEADHGRLAVVVYRKEGAN